MLPIDCYFLTIDQARTLNDFFKSLSNDRKLKGLLNFSGLEHIISQLDFFETHHGRLKYFNPNDYEMRDDA